MKQKVKEILCSNENCKHENKTICLKTDKYRLVNGNEYYHIDCYTKQKRKDDWKTEKEKEDIKEILDMWNKSINKDVNYGLLTKTINTMILNGISSDYLLHTVKTCIKYNLNLKYPGGIKYFVKNPIVVKKYDKHIDLSKPKKIVATENEYIFDKERYKKNKTL